MSFPFHFRGEAGSPVYHKLRFTWDIVEREAEKSGLDVVLLITRSANYAWRPLPEYDPETLVLTVDRMSGWHVTLAHLVEGLSLHVTRHLVKLGDASSFSRWRAAAAKWAEEHRRAMDAYAGKEARQHPPSYRARHKDHGVGKGKWNRAKPHPLHCQALKSDWTPCQAMRMRGTAFCYQHQGWHSNLPDLDDVLGELEDAGWRDLVGGKDDEAGAPA